MSGAKKAKPLTYRALRWRVNKWLKKYENPHTDAVAEKVLADLAAAWPRAVAMSKDLWERKDCSAPHLVSPRHAHVSD